MKIEKNPERQESHETLGASPRFGGVFWEAEPPPLEGERQCECLHHDGDHELGAGRCRRGRCLCGEFVALEDLGAGGAA